MNHFGCNHFASNHFASNHLAGKHFRITVIVKKEHGGYDIYYGPQEEVHARIMQDEQEIIEIMAIIFSSDEFN
jgi:hypothetical protein